MLPFGRAPLEAAAQGGVGTLPKSALHLQLSIQIHVVSVALIDQYHRYVENFLIASQNASVTTSKGGHEACSFPGG
jgi:hypothetical protein